MPKVSVIIPCYNHGAYLDEAVESVLASTFKDFEIVIVNDGSTDKHTISLLKDYQKPQTKIIHSSHQGLAEARNVGIRNSTGAYILPLDADDKISPEYLADAVEVLDRDDEVKIVYCEAQRFGDQVGPFILPPFSRQKILTTNIIFCSAFYKRRDYDVTNGYNKNLVCLEDWDFWLSLLEKGGKAYKIPKTHFYYRFRKDSMLLTTPPKVVEHVIRQVYRNHLELYGWEFHDPISLLKIKNSYEYTVGKTIVRPFKFAKRVLSYLKRRIMSEIPVYNATPLVCIRPPVTYHFLLTNYCNAHCIFCNQRFEEQPKKEITLEKFKTMVSHIPMAQAETFHFSGGGEPLLCPDFLPIVTYVGKIFPWIRIIVRSNGLLIKRYAKQLATLNISRLEISMHGMADTNDAILQRKGSQEIFDGIALLKHYLEEYDKQMYIDFHPAVSMLNAHEIPELIKKAHELKINGVHVYFCRYFPYQARGSESALKDQDSFFYHKWQYDTMIWRMKRLAKKLKVEFSHDPLFFNPTLKLKKDYCCQPWLMILVDWDGDVYPCCGGEEWFKAKVKSGVYHFGNLLNEHVDQCWDNPTYGKARKTCSPTCEEELIPECINCHSTMYFKGPHVRHAHFMRVHE